MIYSKRLRSIKSRILVIDDEDVITGLIKAILTKEGYLVDVCHNGEEGLKRASVVRPDLILMDISMPGISGYAATSRLKADPVLAEIPVVFVSGTSAADDGGRSFEVGGATLVRKPFTNQQLRDVVKFCLEEV